MELAGFEPVGCGNIHYIQTTTLKAVLPGTRQLEFGWTMKLRIENDSLRLRLNRQDVACFLETGRVESTIRFSATRVLGYCVTIVPTAKAASVSYEDDLICVELPELQARQWAANDGEIGVEAVHSGVQILIEKDFQCLHGTGEPDPRAYRHPLA
jgi:hypothetical protein